MVREPEYRVRNGMKSTAAFLLSPGNMREGTDRNYKNVDQHR